jgi:hypothetical protein
MSGRRHRPPDQHHQHGDRHQGFEQQHPHEHTSCKLSGPYSAPTLQVPDRDARRRGTQRLRRDSPAPGTRTLAPGFCTGSTGAHHIRNRSTVAAAASAHSIARNHRNAHRPRNAGNTCPAQARRSGKFARYIGA